jgi:hypothetical protein
MDMTSFIRGQWARIVGALLAAGGLIALILGYVGASGTPYVAEQIPYIVSGAVTGLFLLGAAATLYLSADMQAEWHKLDDIERRLAHMGVSVRADAPEAEVEEPITQPTQVVVTNRGVRRAQQRGHA